MDTLSLYALRGGSGGGSTDLTNVLNDFADAYSASSTYAVGDYCIYNQVLYKCNTAISTAEAWTSAHWTAVNVGDEISSLNEDIAVKYEKPNDGIPSSDMTSAVQSSLALADSSIQSHQSLSAYRTSASQDAIDNEQTRRTNAIFKLNHGQLYDFQTTNDNVYEKTVPTGCVGDTVKMIGGKSVVMNQLVQNGNFVDTSGWIIQNGTLSISSNIATISSITGIYPGLRQKITYTLNHKYYVRFKANPTAGTYVSFSNGVGIDENIVVTSNAWYQYEKIFTANSSIEAWTTVYCFRESTSCSFSNVILIDLTQMFGSGNEPTTVQAFKAMFPKDYYAYNTGSIVSAGCKQVENVGKNLFPQSEIYEVSSTSYVKTVSSGYLFTFIKSLVSGTYTFSWNFVSDGSGGTGNDIRLSKTDGTVLCKLYNGSTTVNLTDAILDNTDMLVFYGYTNLTNCKFSKFQIQKGSTATTYSPYTKVTTQIPQAIQSLTGYGWSAGSVYNEVDYANKKYIQRVGSYTFTGNEFWLQTILVDSVIFYRCQISQINYKRVTGISNNIVGDFKYPSKNVNYVAYNASHTIGITLGSTSTFNGNVLICDDSVSSADDIKSYMTGKTIYYELATPVETDISNLLDEGFLEAMNVESGGSLTFVHDTDDNYRLPVPSTNEWIVDLIQV